MFNKYNLSFLAFYLMIVLFLFFLYPINPTAFEFSFISIKWYGILFVLTLFIARFKLLSDIKRINPSFAHDETDILLIFTFAGMIVGARLLYVFVYKDDSLDYFLNPLKILNLTEGGLSFHGGLIGLIVGAFLFCKKYKVKFLKCMDVIALAAPIGLAEGRLGNFINGELWGKVTNSPVGIVFASGGPFARHPTQLYESFLEGVVLFFILKAFSQKQRKDGSVCGMFLLMYSIFRFSIEFIREPDYNLGYLAWGWLTMGQILCVPMLIVGMSLIFFRSKNSISNKAIV